MQSIDEFIERYVAVWNEPDADRRRRAITELWTEDGAHLSKTLEGRGYAGLEARGAGAYEKWIKGGGFVFESMNNTDSHPNKEIRNESI